MQKAVQYKKLQTDQNQPKNPKQNKTTTSGTKQAAGFHFQMKLILD